MSLEMKTACEHCNRPLNPADVAFICSYECTFCPECRAKLVVCPNCQGELLVRPRRHSADFKDSTALLCTTQRSGFSKHAKERYRPRATRMRGLHQFQNWTLKIYEIRYSDVEIHEAEIQAAIEFVERNTPWPQSASQGYGFVILHYGRDSIWFMHHLWCDDILKQFGFFAPLDKAQDFRPITANIGIGCVWELDLIAHERDAWVQHTLVPEHPSFEACLSDNYVVEIILKASRTVAASLASIGTRADGEPSASTSVESKTDS